MGGIWVIISPSPEQNYLLLILAGASADTSADESAGTCPEMSVNIELFGHIWTA